MSSLAVALFLAVTIKSILDYLAEPIRTKWPTLDLWWFNWLALVLGGAVAWLADLNLFEQFIAVEWLGKLLTAFLVGGGSKLINDVFTNAPSNGGLVMRDGRETYVPRSKDRPKGW